MSLAASVSPADLALRVNGRLEGTCPVSLITGLASLTEAGKTDVTFLTNDKYRQLLQTTKAPLILMAEDFPAPPPAGKAWIRCANPSQAVSTLAAVFAPPPPTFAPGIHPTAVVDKSARVAASAHLAPHVVVEAGAVIGERTVLQAGTTVGQHAIIGSDCLFYPKVTIRERCLVGPRTILHPGVVIGADGFGYDSDQTGHHKIPQTGIVEIGADVEIGANSCVDRARFGVTRIGDGTKIDNLVQIGHNVITGKACMIIAQVGISGSTTLGNGVVLAGQAGIAGHLNLGDGAIVMAQAGISKDLPPKAVVIGTPAVDRRDFARLAMHTKKLPEMSATIKKLQQEIELLKKLMADAN